MSKTKDGFKQVLKELKSKAKPQNVAGMKKYRMDGEKRLGISIPELRKMAKRIDINHQLALKLWETEIPEAMILASMTASTEEITAGQLETWVKDLHSWDVCDQLCMNLLRNLDFITDKVYEWVNRDEEFVKRCAYAAIAELARHKKDADDDFFIQFFPLIKNGSTDERNFVKKAVSWALRNIGKRNQRLNKKASALAKELGELDSQAASWISKDVIKKLTREKVQQRLKLKQNEK